LLLGLFLEVEIFYFYSVFLGNFDHCHVTSGVGGLGEENVTKCYRGVGEEKGLKLAKKSVTYYLIGPFQQFFLKDVTTGCQTSIGTARREV
jgi:hypothetical protein